MKSMYQIGANAPDTKEQQNSQIRSHGFLCRLTDPSVSSMSNSLHAPNRVFRHGTHGSRLWRTRKNTEDVVGCPFTGLARPQGSCR